MAKILDKYYNNPILYDYSLCILIILSLQLGSERKLIKLPSGEFNFDFASDIGAIGLTISGFILTLITILISFKSSQILSDEKLKNDSSPFKIFLSSKLYKRAIEILQKGVISLIIISFLIYFSKLILPKEESSYMFFLNITGLIIILTTFLRCYYVLGLILKMQK
ncbi:hypothetical protein [Flavobacterium degerlachei]|jgi:hypothetical protein|uniref:Uncharacterized protein n=1 Tax=Flavobacterium degerlachei TaxID=229203 RepID=A0A1H3B9A4_9FLAO|nr:hypothetical protein [Flavobacterium degerlachei]SDX38258.1 hypothetical protein SAMN05444338_109186 [Flavobacterium degerlachei]